MLSVEEQARIWSRFFSKVDRSGACWLWTGARTTAGYGSFRTAGKAWLAHRLAWFLLHGENPGKLFVCHRCDNPPCINPLHLFLGTAKDNAADMSTKQRAARRCREKLSDQDVIEILELHSATGWGSKNLAKALDVNRGSAEHFITTCGLRSC